MKKKLLAALAALLMLLAASGSGYHEADTPQPEVYEGATMEYVKGVTIIWR